MKHVWQDLIYGFRMLLKKPGFTIVAALSLALGIGANTVIFSLINTTLLRPLPFADSGKLVVIWTVPLKDRTQRNGVNVSSYYAFRDKSQLLSSDCCRKTSASSVMRWISSALWKSIARNRKASKGSFSFSAVSRRMAR